MQICLCENIKIFFSKVKDTAGEGLYRFLVEHQQKNTEPRS